MGGLIVERAFLQAMIGYGITNAPTSDQVDSLERTQKAAGKEYKNQKIAAEIICDEKQLELVEAEEKAGAANEAFQSYGATADKLETQRNVCIDELRSSLKTRAESLLKPAENLKTKLDNSVPRSGSERSRFLVGLAADAIYHTNDDVPDSIHHCLQGLAAWARQPKSDVDPTSKDSFRKTPEEYVDEIRSGASSGMVLAEPLFNVLVNAFDELRANGKTELIREIEDFFHIAPFAANEVRGSDNLGALVKDFQETWKSFVLARDALKAWTTEKNFVALKEGHEAAKNRVNGLKIDIRDAENQIASCARSETEANELAAKLDLVRERPPADLILLINPASEATLAQQMQDVWEKDRAGFLLRKMWREPDRPWIMSISSDSDLATRLGYPAAMGLSRVFRGAARVPENVWMTHTAPHLKSMQTHRVKSNRHKKRGFELEDIRTPEMARTPLWIINADKETVKSHNIDTGNFVRLVPFLLEESKVLSRAKPVNNRSFPQE